MHKLVIGFRSGTTLNTCCKDEQTASLEEAKLWLCHEHCRTVNKDMLYVVGSLRFMLFCVESTHVEEVREERDPAELESKEIARRMLRVQERLVAAQERHLDDLDSGEEWRGK